MKRLFAGLIFALLAACSTTPQSPAQAVYAVQGNYAAALTIAVAYKSLPDCAATTAVLCKKADIVGKLQKADDAAYPALQAAQNIVRQPNAGANAQTAIFAAEQAVSALTSITSTLQVK